MRNSVFHFFIVWAFLSPLPGFNQETSVTSSSSRASTVIRRSDGFGLQNFDIEMRGKIEVTDDDKDIKSMSPDGYLEITKTVFGSRRTLVITPQGGGLKREYYEGRTSLPYEPEGRKWLNEILPELVRTTTIGAEGRVNRIFRQNAAPGVLGEIDQLESDYVKHHYANLLVRLGSIPAKDLPTIVDRITVTLDSDYYLAEFLQKNSGKLLSTRESTQAVFRACGNMESDHYKTEVIKEALNAQPPGVESIRIILEASGRMDSDHYKTEVLSAVMRHENLPDAIISEIINGSKALESDHYRTVVLKKSLAYDGLSSISYQRVLESVKDIESDHYKTEVLTSLLTNKLPTDQIFNLVSLSNSIESDHYLTVVFKEVLRKQELSDESFNTLIKRAANVDSDHYASTILKYALELPNLGDAKLLSVLVAASNIESDHYITEVLLEAAPAVKSGSAQLKDTYRKTAQKLESETYYGRALRAID